MTKITWDAKGFFVLQLPVNDGSQDMKSKAEPCIQELKQKPWRNTGYWLALLGLLSLFSSTTQYHLPGDGHEQCTGPY